VPADPVVIRKHYIVHAVLHCNIFLHCTTNLPSGISGVSSVPFCKKRSGLQPFVGKPLAGQGKTKTGNQDRKNITTKAGNIQ
jgi:hypothetical protein